MNKNDENRVMYLLKCCDINGEITLNKDDMLLILVHQRELGREDAIIEFVEWLVNRGYLDGEDGSEWRDDKRCVNEMVNSIIDRYEKEQLKGEQDEKP